jgi:ABC-type lipoprotein export system ATPase subunit
MKNNPLFKIENLTCSYNNIDPVLFIKELEIPTGEICVLFGRSGSGKSTLLETLGLMSNTITQSKNPINVIGEKEKISFNKDDKMSIKFYGKNEEITYVDKLVSDFKNNNDIWSDNKKNKLIQHKLRENYFSFIFQNTNLMSNFTVEQNAAIPELAVLNSIKCDFDKNKCPYKEFSDECDMETGTCAIIHARQTLVKDLNIPFDKLKETPLKLSGGQKQRITFARAHNSKFTVLFGDEPTGNLDAHNSEELMKVVRRLIEEEKDKSAIIVSHSIPLTLQFSDRIVLIDTKKYEDIDKKVEQYYGVIDSESIYTSTSSTDDYESRVWNHLDRKDIKYNEMNDILNAFLRK